MHINDLKSLARRTLHERRLQKAGYGSSADPIITIQIQDLEKLIPLIERARDIPYATALEERIMKSARGLGINIEGIEYDV